MGINLGITFAQVQGYPQRVLKTESYSFDVHSERIACHKV